MSNNAVLVIRLFADVGYINLKSMVPPLQQEQNPTKTLNQGLDDAGVYNSGNYRTVFNLVTHRRKRSVNDLLKRTMEAFVLLKLLLLSDEYYVDNFGNKIIVKDDEILFTGAMLMHHMMILWCNADTIGEIQVSQSCGCVFFKSVRYSVCVGWISMLVISQFIYQTTSSDAEALTQFHPRP